MHSRLLIYKPDRSASLSYAIIKMYLLHVLSIIMLVKFGIGEVPTSSLTELSTVFEVLGYTPVCVSSALTVCEHKQKPVFLLSELKQIFKEVKCENNYIYKQCSDVNESLNELVSVFSPLISSLTSNRLEDKLQSITKYLQELLNASGSSSRFEKFIGDEIYSLRDNSKKELELLKDEVTRNIQGLRSLITSLDSRFTKAEITQNDVKKLVQGLIVEINRNDSVLLEEIKQLRNEIPNLLPKDVESILTTSEPPQKTPDFTSSRTLMKHKDCAGIKGVQTIYPNDKPVEVFCDEKGWTVIQNRDFSAFRQDFNRPWSEYVTGFGSKNGEFWLGLENIHTLVKSTPMELKVDLEDFDGVRRWARYDSFKIGGASTKYALTLGKYSGDAGDALSSHDGMKFSTFDQDNDNHPIIHCSLKFRGAWWYNACETSNLNGFQHREYYSSPYAEGIGWDTFHPGKYSLKKARMSIRAI